MKNNLDPNENIDLANYIRNIVQQEILKSKIQEIKEEQILFELKRRFNDSEEQCTKKVF